MTRSRSTRRRPAVNITLGRAARLYRLVALLAERPRDRDSLLAALGIGLRTFYRELDLLRRCSIRIQRAQRAYTLKTSPEEAQGYLPFPDPQLSFAEMAELARHQGEAAARLAGLLDSVIKPPTTKPGRGKRKAKKGT